MTLRLMKTTAAVACALAICSSLVPTLATAQEESSEVSYQAARNHAGLMTYCVDKGFIDAQAAESSKKRIAALVKNTPTGENDGDLAEEKGRTGVVISGDGSDIATDLEIDELATRMKVTVEQLCKVKSLQDTL